MPNILLVEDDITLNNGIKIALNMDSHVVTDTYTFSEALKLISQNTYDLVLLDINLPDGNGTDLCDIIRTHSSIPIFFLTANDTESDIIKGFQRGCDDYIVKPFSTNVLRQKVKAILKRVSVEETNSNKFSYKKLEVDFDKILVKVNNQDCKLTATEYKLLEYFILNKGKVLTRSKLLEQIWDVDGNFVDENTLTVLIKRLRSKLGEDNKNPEYIKTIFGIGYTFGD